MVTPYPPPVDLEFQELTRNGRWWISNDFFGNMLDSMLGKNFYLIFSPDKNRVIDDEKIQDDTVGTMDLYEAEASENRNLSGCLKMTIGNVRFDKFQHTALAWRFKETNRKRVFEKRRVSPLNDNPEANVNADKKQ